MRRVMWILCASLVTSACATTPRFDKITGVTPKVIVDVLECEIIAAKQKNRIRRARQEELKRMKVLPANYVIPDLERYYAVAELTLQVDEQATLAPSFTHTDPVSKTFTRVFDWGVKLDTQAHRVYSETVAFRINGMHDSKNSCAERRAGISLKGKLGIDEVVDMAFGSIDPDDQGIDFPEGTAEVGDSGGRRGSGSKSASKSVFGTSLEFSIVGAITASGPTWTLVHFKGPGKLFGTQRNDTHKVTISFAQNPNEARMQNLRINSEILPSSLTRQLQLNLQ